MIRCVFGGAPLGRVFSASIATTFGVLVTDTHSLRDDSQCKPTKNTQPDDTGANYFPRLLYLCRELQRSKVDAKKLQIPTPKRVSPRLRLLSRESRFEYRLGSQTWAHENALKRLLRVAGPIIHALTAP